MIQLYHVFKEYESGDIPALSDVTVSFAKGEFVFVTGPSGAGKTTLLKLVFREELPTRGQVLVHGQSLSSIHAREIPRFRRQISVVFQDFRLLNRRTVMENVGFIMRVFGIPAEERKKRCLAALHMVGLEHRYGAYPLTLSGGEQQRVAIARALAMEPLILLADEPTGNLDPERAEEIMQLFLDINARGTTVVVATHNREVIKRMNRRVVALENGRIAETVAFEETSFVRP
jgi:cell division transport system ATP-binding protein